MNKPGPKPCPIREAWTLRYNLSKKRRRELTWEFMKQLSFCK